MKFKTKVATKYHIRAFLTDWSGEWVHYTDINKLGVNPQQFHQDLAGIYLFPKEFKTRGTIWKKKKYKFIVKVQSDAKILDLSKLKEDDLWSLLEKLNIPKTYFNEEKINVDSFWDALKNYYILSTKAKGSAFWNKEFRRLGYDGIFDDTESIHSAEVQLVALDPKILKIIDVETQNISRGQYERIQKHLNLLAHHLSHYGTVDIKPLKKKKELWGDKKVLKGEIKLSLGNEKYIDWAVSEDEANHEMWVGAYYTNISKLHDSYGSFRDSVLVKYQDDSEIKKLVERVMKKAI